MLKSVRMSVFLSYTELCVFSFQPTPEDTFLLIERERSGRERETEKQSSLAPRMHLTGN